MNGKYCWSLFLTHSVYKTATRRLAELTKAECCVANKTEANYSGIELFFRNLQCKSMKIFRFNYNVMFNSTVIELLSQYPNILHGNVWALG